MDNKVISYAVLATVVVLMVGSLLVPIIQDMTDDHTTTYYNSPAGNLIYSLDSDDHTFSYVAGDTVIDVDGVDYTLGSTCVYIMSDGVIILASSNGVTLYNGATKVISNDATKDVTVAFSNGAASITYGENTYANTYTWLFTPDEDGDYVNVGITSSSQVYYSDFTKLALAQVLSSKLGILKDGTATLGGEAATFSGTSKNQTGTDGAVKYYEGAVTISDGTSTISPSYIFAEKQITYVDESDGTLGLIAALPVLVLVVVIVGAIGLIQRRD